MNPEKGSEYGITTGSAATAAAIAAYQSTNGNISSVDVETPIGELKIDVECSKKLTDTSGKACVIKRPYNDPDVTKNIKICAEVQVTETPFIKINGGEGVGVITKPGLQVSVGEPAINPVPRSMIRENLKKILPEKKGAEITIYVPGGEKIAEKTMNPKLGILGGISILGTTGIARSMSLESYKHSFKCHIDVAVAQGYKDLVFVPGNIGQNLALRVLDVEEDQIIQMGNFVGYMLEEASNNGVERITLFGHAGKLVKIAAGIFNTKHSIADGRREIIAAYSALAGARSDTIRLIFESETTERMLDVLEAENLTVDVFNRIADAIRDRCQERYKMDFNVVIVKMDGTVLNDI